MPITAGSQPVIGGVNRKRRVIPVSAYVSPRMILCPRNVVRFGQKFGPFAKWEGSGLQNHNSLVRFQHGPPDFGDVEERPSSVPCHGTNRGFESRRLRQNLLSGGTQRVKIGLS